MDFTDKILKQYERLMAEQLNWRTLWQEIADYIVPHKSYIVAVKSPGSKQTEKLFDSTAIHANELLASSLGSAITPANAPWFTLRLRGIEDTGDISRWLEDCTKKTQTALNQSNFNTEIHEVYYDYGSFGIGALFCDEREVEVVGFNGLNFTSLPVGSYAIEENSEGKVNVLHRKFRISARAAFSKWGKSLSEKSLQIYEKAPEKMIPFLHAVYPTEKGNRAKEQKPFESVYIDFNGKHLISKGGFYEFPYFVPRWSKSSGEVYGRGPGATALPDIKTLNKAKEYGFRAWAKAIDPPLLVKDDGVIGSVKTYASGINYVRDMGNIAQLESKARFDVHAISKADLQSSIRRIFFSDQLQLQESPQMTATEAYIRYELMQRLLGPTLGRLESELLTPLIERIFGLMFRAGIFPPPPEELRGQDIDIEYEGPLAKAQKSGTIMTMQKFFSAIGGIAQIDSQVFDNINLDAATREIAGASGIPATILYGEKDVKRIRDLRTQAMEKQKQMEEMQKMADMAGKAGKLLPAMKEMMPQGTEGIPAQGIEGRPA